MHDYWKTSHSFPLVLNDYTGESESLWCQQKVFSFDLW